VPTAVPTALFSLTANVWFATTGGSLRLLRLTVIVFVPLAAGTPLSVTCTVRLKLGVAS
jgi:hypothetical protein